METTAQPPSNESHSSPFSGSELMRKRGLLLLVPDGTLEIGAVKRLGFGVRCQYLGNMGT